MDISFKLRLKIYMRDSFSCVYCKRAMNPLSDDLSLDHFNADGNSTEDNLVTACRTCNTRKGVRPVDEFKEVLRQEAELRAEISREPGQSIRTLNQISKEVCRQLGITPLELCRTTKHHHSVHARTEFSVIARKEGYSYPEIGRFLGRHHTTIMSLVRKRELTRITQEQAVSGEISESPTTTSV